MRSFSPILHRRPEPDPVPPQAASAAPKLLPSPPLHRRTTSGRIPPPPFLRHRTRSPFPRWIPCYYSTADRIPFSSAPSQEASSLRHTATLPLSAAPGLLVEPPPLLRCTTWAAAKSLPGLPSCPGLLSTSCRYTSPPPLFRVKRGPACNPAGRRSAPVRHDRGGPRTA